MIKRQTITAAICAILAVVLGITYFCVISPMLVEEEKKSDPVELLDPNEVHTGDMTEVYMFAPLGRERIDKIEVYNDNDNANDDYIFYKTDKKNNTFKIKGMEDAPYSTYALSYVILATGNGIASEKYPIKENTDLAAYGLSDPKTHFTITYDGNKTHTVWVGNRAKSGDGYYCRYDGRDVIYLIRTQYTVLFSDVYSLLSPNLGLPVEQEEYAGVTRIGVYKNGEPIMMIKTVYDYDKNGNVTSYDFDFDIASLKNFLPDENVRNDLISKVSGLAGTKVVAFGKEETTNKKLKDNYGIDLDNVYYGIYYEKIASDYQSLEDVYIFFSKPNKEGVSYAYTTAYGGIVVTIASSNIPLYRYDTVDYVSKFLDMTAITDISKIEIKNGVHPDKKGVVINTAYGIKSAVASDATDPTVQSVWHVGTGEYLSPDRVQNFKMIYGDFVKIQPMDEVDVTRIENEEHIASVTITYTDGTSKTFDFYAYSTTRCYYTVNGELTKNRTFSVNRDSVDNLIRDVYNFEQGYTLG